jgi:thiamine pyrophosphate-dependent acetolactate synthase large subunit-like protein
MTSNLLDRRALTAALLARRDGALIVPGLGSPTWDCFAAGDSADYLYSWGGMGLALPTALGVALARPDRRVCCLTGDGEMMMGLGSLAVVGAERPQNLSVLVLDNEHFGETGRQPGLTRTLDLAAMAAASGIGATMRITGMDQMEELAAFLFREPGPSFAVAKIALGEHPLLLPEKDGAIIARRFRDAAAGGASSQGQG